MGKNQDVTLRKLKKSEIQVKIKGITSLLSNRFPEEAINQIEDKQKGKARTALGHRDPEKEYKNSIHWFSDGKRTGFPAGGFKAAMVRAGKQLGFAMTDLKGAFFIKPEEGDLVEIKGKHEFNRGVGRLPNGIPNITYRAEFKEWSATLKIRYLENIISTEQLVNLVDVAGFSCGVGDYRPNSPKSASGTHGCFEVILS
jgi:hypothetical protein